MRLGNFIFAFLAGAAALPLAFGVQPAFAQVQGQWTSAGAMQSPRESEAQVALSNGSVLAVGGIDNFGNILASAELFNPATNTWSTTGSMGAGRQQPAAVVLTNGDVLVTGGLGTGGAVLRTAELYSSAKKTWSPAGSLSVARFAHSATLLQDGRVLVTGGCTVSGACVATGASELYNPATNTWSTTGALKTARRSHNAVRLNDGRVLAIGGSTGAATASCELYNPSTGKWSVAASANSLRYLSTANLLPSGKVLVAGGASGRFPMNSAELYDPTANTWTLTGAMTFGTYAHSSAALPDGTSCSAAVTASPSAAARIAPASYRPPAPRFITKRPANSPRPLVCIELSPITPRRCWRRGARWKQAASGRQPIAAWSSQTRQSTRP
jgi:N-acetylneuraminic acid mutarotase